MSHLFWQLCGEIDLSTVLLQVHIKAINLRVTHPWMLLIEHLLYIQKYIKNRLYLGNTFYHSLQNRLSPHLLKNVKTFSIDVKLTQREEH
jgi:hypothetical protein